MVGRRVGAFLIDFLITGVLYWGLFFLFAERRTESPDESIQASLTLGDTSYAITGGRAAVFFLAFLALGFAYWSVLPGLTGWTVGKLVTGIRVVGADGTLPAGVGRNLLRQVVGVVDYFPYFLPGLVGFVVALADGRNRRLGDMAGKTYVVRREAAGAPLSLDAGAGAPSAAQPGPVSASPPGWYEDPSRQARLRYWDGRSWTDHTAA